MIRFFWTLLLATTMMALLVQAPSAQAEEAAESAADRVAVGDEAPAISLPDSAGTVHESAELRGEKNLVVVFFRGAW